MSYYPIKKNTDVALLPPPLLAMFGTLGGATLNEELGMYVCPEAPDLGFMLAMRRVRTWTCVNGWFNERWVNSAVPAKREVIRMVLHRLPAPPIDKATLLKRRGVEFTVEPHLAAQAIPELLFMAGFDYVLLTRRRKLRALISS